METKPYFLEFFDEIGKNEATAYVSGYNFNKLRTMKLSPLRWVSLENGLLAPGQGSGTLIIADVHFKVTYAWGGRHLPDSNERGSYTVRMEGDVEKLKDIRDQIVKDEHGALTFDVPYRESSRQYHEKMAQIEPGKAFVTVRGPVTYRKHMLALNERLKKAGIGFKGWSKKEIDKMVKDFTKKWRDPKAVVVHHHPFDRIDADML